RRAAPPGGRPDPGPAPERAQVGHGPQPAMSTVTTSNTGHRRVQVDWAGPHGTAWGTVNACLTTVTVSWVGHLACRWWPGPPGRMAGWAVAGTILGVLGVLARAAASRRRVAGATVAYQVCCCAGAGGWTVHMLAAARWGLRWWLSQAAVLAVMAIVA